MTPQWELDQELQDAIERAYRFDRRRFERVRRACSDINGLGGAKAADRQALGVLRRLQAIDGPGRTHLDGGRAAGATGGEG